MFAIARLKVPNGLLVWAFWNFVLLTSLYPNSGVW